MKPKGITVIDPNALGPIEDWAKAISVPKSCLLRAAPASASCG